MTDQLRCNICGKFMDWRKPMSFEDIYYTQTVDGPPEPPDTAPVHPECLDKLYGLEVVE